MTATPLVPNVTLHQARIEDWGPLTVPDPEHGDLRLAVFPFTHALGVPLKLPAGFGPWEATLREIMSHVPYQEGATQFFVTIDTKFFTTPGYLRREGVHMDGNFCADPDFRSIQAPDRVMETWGGERSAPGAPFPKETWGGDPEPPKETWGATWGGKTTGLRAVGRVEKPDNSHVEVGFSLPYDIVVPLGTYVSGELGGTLVASSYEGCQAWPGDYVGEVGSGGDWSEMMAQLGEPVPISANRLWFMTSNCPHETMPIPAGARRTFIRVTLPHNYDNSVL